MKQNNGITLIALIITIIVLLILAGVSISMLLGTNGLINNANKTKEVSDYNSAKERVVLELMEAKVQCAKEQKEYTITEISKEIKEDNEITIEKYYNNSIAKIKNGVTENIVNLNGVVVSVNQYEKFKFLIGKSCEIEGVTLEEITDQIGIEDFIKIEIFEKKTTDKYHNETTTYGRIVKLAGIAKEYSNERALLDDEDALRIIMNNDSASQYMIECEGIYLSTISNSASKIRLLANSTYASKYVMLNNNWREAVFNGDYATIFDEGSVKIPQLTQDINSTEKLKYSSQHSNSSYHIWKMFDGDISTRGYFNGATNQWVQYEFDEQVVPYKVEFCNFSDEGYRINDFTLYGSNDGQNFEVLIPATHALQEPPTTMQCYYVSQNFGRYKYVRFFVDKQNTGNSGNNICVPELQFYCK